ncbi:MAG: hypothetical protein EPN88_13965 [Bacteroidetes bacterium]|nr:MAG: hypothetical protein EPN88_13965 [Bacteroidota bacterium]
MFNLYNKYTILRTDNYWRVTEGSDKDFIKIEELKINISEDRCFRDVVFDPNGNIEVFGRLTIEKVKFGDGSTKLYGKIE